MSEELSGGEVQPAVSERGGGEHRGSTLAQ